MITATNNVFVQIILKRGGTRLDIHNSIQYRRRDDLAFPETLYKTEFIEVDKTIFNLNRNIIIGKIYNPPPQN